MLQVIPGFLASPARRRRLVLVLLVSALGGFTIGAAWSRSYWGYAFVRPGPDRRILSATEVTGRSSIIGTPQGPKCQFRLGPVEPGRTAADDDTYYNPCERLLKALRNRHIDVDGLPAVETPSAEALSTLLEPLRSTIFQGDSEGIGCIRGEILRLAANDGSHLLVVMGSVPAPHHKPYYEVVFAERAGDWQPISTNRFFYDVATWEGLEWPVLHAATTLLGIIAALAVLAVLAISRMLAQRLEER